MDKVDACDRIRGCLCGKSIDINDTKHVIKHIVSFLKMNELEDSVIHEFRHQIAEKYGVSLDDADPIMWGLIRDADPKRLIVYTDDDGDIRYGIACKKCKTKTSRNGRNGMCYDCYDIGIIETESR